MYIHKNLIFVHVMISSTWLARVYRISHVASEPLRCVAVAAPRLHSNRIYSIYVRLSDHADQIGPGNQIVRPR